MKKEILYTTAYNEQNILVMANDADKRGKYSCPVCKTKMILRKSGKTGKGSKRPHFAHNALTTNCTPEGVLHYSFKRMLVEIISKNIEAQIPLSMNWKCKYCENIHTGNLLKNVSEVKEEYYLKECKPDIALLNKDGVVFAVIEIVVTHAPEESVVNYYHNNNIILIQINVNSEDDLNNIENKVANPDIVDLCTHPKCKKHGNYSSERKIVVLDTSCYKCRAPTKISYILSNNNFVYPSAYSEKERAIADEHGVLLKLQYSRTTNSKYIANTCSSCGAFTGDYYLMDDYMIEHVYDENLPAHTIGYYCEECGEYL
jgi:ssDNA-binding Zn-finger/Zn-ribbon topoisomerase 1